MKSRKRTRHSDSNASKTHLTVSELAERWSVSPAYVRREIWSGRLRAARFGRAVRVSFAEADRFAAAAVSR